MNDLQTIQYTGDRPYRQMGLLQHLQQPRHLSEITQAEYDYQSHHLHVFAFWG